MRMDAWGTSAAPAVALQDKLPSAACFASACSRQSPPVCDRAISTLRQALERAGDHAAAHAAYERALDLGAEPNPMQPCTAAPAAPAPPGGQHGGGAAGAPADEAPPSLTAEEVAASLGGLARAALRQGDLDLGLHAAAAAADAALSLACAGILERQGRLEVSAPHSAGLCVTASFARLPTLGRQSHPEGEVSLCPDSGQPPEQAAGRADARELPRDALGC
jgi:hypothetical protein